MAELALARAGRAEREEMLQPKRAARGTQLVAGSHQRDAECIQTRQDTPLTDPSVHLFWLLTAVMLRGLRRPRSAVSIPKRAEIVHVPKPSG